MSGGEFTQIGMLVGAVTVLSSVITMLWRQVMAHHAKVDATLEETRAQLQDCTEDRTMIWKTLANQAGCDVEQLKERAQ